MAVAMILIALVCLYLLFVTGSFIARQITINKAVTDCLGELAKWHEEEDREIEQLSMDVERIETIAGNAQNKATETARKLDRSVVYDTEH